jgi:hypothetical protein
MKAAVKYFFCWVLPKVPLVVGLFALLFAIGSLSMGNALGEPKSLMLSTINPGT